MRLEITERCKKPPWLTKEEYGPVRSVFHSSVAAALNVSFVPRAARFGRAGMLSTHALVW